MRWMVMLLLVGPTAVTAAPVPKSSAKRTNYYPLAIGWKWEYVMNGNADEVTTEEVTERVEKDGVATVTTVTDQKSGKYTYTVSGGDVYIAAKPSVEFRVPFLLCPSDLTAGSTRQMTYRCRAFEYQVDVSIGKPEEVTTPAGKFTAVPVTHKYTSTIILTQVYWFADGVGLVKVAANGKTLQELKAFTPAKTDDK